MSLKNPIEKKNSNRGRSKTLSLLASTRAVPGLWQDSPMLKLLHNPISVPHSTARPSCAVCHSQLWILKNIGWIQGKNICCDALVHTLIGCTSCCSHYTITTVHAFKCMDCSMHANASNDKSRTKVMAYNSERNQLLCRGFNWPVTTKHLQTTTTNLRLSRCSSATLSFTHHNESGLAFQWSSIHFKSSARAVCRIHEYKVA